MEITYEGLMSLALVLGFSCIGAFLVELLGGVRFPNWLGGCRTKKCIQSFKLPGFFGTILFGCLARNTFGGLVTEYDDSFAGNLRIIALVVILLRVGLETEFKGRLLLVTLLGFNPMTTEMFVVAVASKMLLAMSWPVSFATGFLISAGCCPAVTVPALVKLQLNGRGAKKGIPVTLITAASFNDIFSFAGFSFFLAIVTTSSRESDVDSTTIAIHIFLEILSGVGGGFILGLLGLCFKKAGHTLKTIYLLSFTAGIVVFYDYIGFPEAKYLAVIFFGYSNHRIWGHNQPID